MRAALWIAALVVALAGCSVDVDTSGMPGCAPPANGLNSTLVLIAQSVPTASQLPCVRAVPVGWEFGDLRAGNGGAKFQLIASREQSQEVVVELRDECDVSGATKLSSQNPGIRRFERITESGSAYVGERYYVYEGGCTTYRFDLPGPDGGQTLNTVAGSLGFVSRQTLSQQVHDHSDGRLELDPSPSAAASGGEA
ncbi:MAG TPA: hypothetical protein VKE25_12670 [Actinomycetes bacterium]|nr:hypothetical protein [Actinomycetes bacterium]